MTQKTEDVVGRIMDEIERRQNERANGPFVFSYAAVEQGVQSLSDRLAAQNGLLRRARSLIRPYCEADEELRAFSDELTVCLVEGKE